jgi:hypothetical protein
MTITDRFCQSVTRAAPAAPNRSGVVKECFVLIDVASCTGFDEMIFGDRGGVAIPSDILHTTCGIDIFGFAPLVLEDVEDAALGLHEGDREAVDNIRMTFDAKDPGMFETGGVADDTPMGDGLAGGFGVTPMAGGTAERFDWMIAVNGVGISVADHTLVGRWMGSLRQ